MRGEHALNVNSALRNTFVIPFTIRLGLSRSLLSYVFCTKTLCTFFILSHTLHVFELTDLITFCVEYKLCLLLDTGIQYTRGLNRAYYTLSFSIRRGYFVITHKHTELGPKFFHKITICQGRRKMFGKSKMRI